MTSKTAKKSVKCGYKFVIGPKKGKRCTKHCFGGFCRDHKPVRKEKKAEYYKKVVIERVDKLSMRIKNSNDTDNLNKLLNEFTFGKSRNGVKLREGIVDIRSEILNVKEEMYVLKIFIEGGQINEKEVDDIKPDHDAPFVPKKYVFNTDIDPDYYSKREIISKYEILNNENRFGKCTCCDKSEFNKTITTDDLDHYIENDILKCIIFPAFIDKKQFLQSKKDEYMRHNYKLARECIKNSYSCIKCHKVNDPDKGCRYCLRFRNINGRHYGTNQQAEKKLENLSKRLVDLINKFNKLNNYKKLIGIRINQLDNGLLNE